MNKQELMDKVKTLMENDTFTAKLAAANDLDEMAAAFQAEGIDVTGAELEAVVANKRSNVELGEEDLSQVSGGGFGAAALIVFIGGSLLWGYIDGVKKKVKACRRG